MTTVAICQQSTPCCSDPTPFQDGDEVRCRTCHRRISHPRRTPGEGDAASVKGENLAVAGIARMGARTAPDTPDIRVSCVKCRHSFNANARVCVGCNDAVVALARDGNYRLPAFTAPRLLECRCCKAWLPQFSFYRSPTTPGREHRFARCRVCCSQRARNRREENPEPKRIRDSAYSRKIQEERKQGKRAPVYDGLSADQKARMAEACIRYRARLNGHPVPLLRPGTNRIYLKHVCRAVQCPLRLFQVNPEHTGH